MIGDLISELLVPIVIGIAAIAITGMSKNQNQQNKASKFQEWIKAFEEQANQSFDDEDYNDHGAIPTHLFEDSGQEHSQTRDHRIFEQAQKIDAHSESLPRKRLVDEKVTLKKDTLKKQNLAVVSNKIQAKPKHLVKSTVFRDQEEVQKAIIYGDILGTPVSRKRNR